MYTVHPSGCSMFLFQDFHSSWCFPKYGMSVIQNWASNVIFLQQHALLHFHFFSAFNMFGWCWMAIPKPFLRATRWCGTIRPPCRRCNTSPRRQLSKSSDAQKNWAITLQAWTIMMPRNKHVSFFQVVSFFEHGIRFRFTTCTPKIVILRCSCDQIGVSSAIWNDVFPSQYFCSLHHLTLDIVY